MAAQLRALGFTGHKGIGDTGIGGILRNGTGNAVVLCADMDGLPIVEETDHDHASTITAAVAFGATTGIVHAYGHDIYMVCLLGAAKVLAADRSRWSGSLIIVFQPAEENARGAQAMLNDDLFSIVSRSIASAGTAPWESPCGILSNTVGPAMAAPATSALKLRGRGAYESRPQTSRPGVDFIVDCDSAAKYRGQRNRPR